MSFKHLHKQYTSQADTIGDVLLYLKYIFSLLQASFMFLSLDQVSSNCVFARGQENSKLPFKVENILLIRDVECAEPSQ